jgi:hypothetical protein
MYTRVPEYDLELGVPQCIIFKDHLLEKISSLKEEKFWEGILCDTSLRGRRYEKWTIWDEINYIKNSLVEINEQAKGLENETSLQEIFEKETTLQDLLETHQHHISCLKKWLRGQSLPSLRHLKLLI